MRQSDPQYLKQYADQEQNLHPEKFIFFDEERAVDILHRNGMKYPDIVSYPEERLREMLRTAQVDAWQAYKLFQDGKHVAHIAYAFTARHSIS